MSTVRKTITFTSQQDSWIKKQVQKGDFTNDSEYVRALIRRDQNEYEKVEALKVAIQEGLDSGESPENVNSIWDRVKERNTQSDNT